MSVNITVNGKFAKHCRTHPLLDDPQQVRKQEEQERRKLRLLQVREESKKLAKKIRDEVNEEKKRELQKLQATKEQELECWRQHALEGKREDYRTAIFQIGTAHNAARKEKQQQAEKQKAQGSYKDFKKQMAAKKQNQEKVQFDANKNCKCQHTGICPQILYKCVCTPVKTRHKYNDEPHKRKRDTCFSSSSSESECEDEGYKEQTLPQSSLSTTSSSFDSSLSSLGNNRATQTSMFVPTNKQNLCKTPAVFLDVEVGTDDSVTITAPAEVNDKHAEYNRQFRSVIRVSPSKGRNTKDNRCENPQAKQVATSTTTSSTTQSYEATEKEEDFGSKNTKCSPAKYPQPNQPATKEKRFTLISDLVRKQQDEPQTTNTLPPAIPTAALSINHNKPALSRATTSRATSAAATPQLSPRKQARNAISRPKISQPTSLSPRKISAGSSKALTEKSHPSSSVTASVNNRILSGSSSSGRVQFYDYNSKLCRDRAQAQTVARVERQQDSTQPTAMEQAAMEKQREKERQDEMYQKSKQVEERGQKALEREQVRRDCSELTEKLEALTREYPRQLPTSENHPHLFADKQLRKEGKMNTALEKLLNRPNIITCSELNKYNDNTAEAKSKTNEHLGALYNELNVGASPKAPLPADDVSSDSCCSILLGYVDDQSRLVRQDLKQWSHNDDNDTNEKQKRLKSLLKRLDLLRNSLMQELKMESESKKEKLGMDKSKYSSKEENLRQVINSISEMRKEREQILVNEIGKEPRPLREREKELQAKEAILEEKVREFFELQKQQNKVNKEVNQEKAKTAKESTHGNDKEKKQLGEAAEDKENIKCSLGENPLEIIITVRGQTQSVKIPQKSKRKISARKSPGKLASLIRSPQTKGVTAAKRPTPKKKMVPVVKPLSNQGVLKRQNSYDSNSTSYMSLPPKLPTKIDDLPERITKERQHYNTPISSAQFPTGIRDQHQVSAQESESSLEPFEDTTSYQQPPRINPLIAQYVQRLLGMPRSAVQKLGVSSSDIETPGSTIINTSNNMTSSEAMITNEHLLNIHNFVEENKSFIKDLEQSIRTQNNESLELSLKVFEEIWRQRLRNKDSPKENLKEKMSRKNRDKQISSQIKQKAQESRQREERKLPAYNKTSKIDDVTQRQSSSDQQKEARTKELMEIITNSNKKSSQQGDNQKRTSIEKTTISKSLKSTRKSDLEKSPSSQYSTDEKETPKTLKKQTLPAAVQKVDKAIETRLSQESHKSEADTQIARYAKLTENCTHRIAELTELINRVREEKQRLLEVTLSSVSDTGRQSTEYLELPDAKSSTRNDQEDLTRISSSSEETTTQKQTHSSETLHDIPTKLSSSDKNKQITASRDSGIAESRPMTAQENRIDQEPISLSSSETAIAQPQRKLKPPPTIKRFSPQLPDDDLAHELSTILEVDTPATSRINTAVGQSQEERIIVTETEKQQPKKFPTFEEYVIQLDLDLTQLDPEQSVQLQQEFYSFLECLQQQQRSPQNPPQYNEFPSVNAYIESLLESGCGHGLTIEESLAQLRISGIQPQNFPAVRDYLKRNASKLTGEEQQLIDTESLENITEEAAANTDSGSMDIEKELKRRNILKNSFRFVETKQKVFSSTAHRGDAAFYQDLLAAESGVDKLSTSDNTIALLESDLKKMVHQWPGEARKRSQQHYVLSSTTTSANTSAIANSALRAASMDDSSTGMGRPLNLRDFLTRELLKHANISASTTSSSSDESLRSHFLHSIIGSLTPRTNGAASKSGAQTLDRQKTSTPVPMQSSTTSSGNSNTSSGQLFSGESRISSVRYHDRSVRFFTSDGDKADQSSE